MTSGLGHARRRAHQGRGKRAAIQGEERGKSKEKEAEEGREEGGKGRGEREEPVGGGGRKSLIRIPFPHHSAAIREGRPFATLRDPL